ncbi:MAG: 50S ribosomal protein L9 [Phycisphaeraceae bacterium]|nr:50S ribosomal protein L9 [Phycisphaeraceae bacterium]
MNKSRIELLLNRNVENLGIVGDVVKVKPGFARNYLLPHRIAEHPTPEKIEALKEARAKAQAELARLRSERVALIERIDSVTIKLVRSCNDQGLLYGAVSQRDIADQLVADGYGVDTRAVRLASPIRRIGTYHCVIQFDRDLRAEIHIDVLPDRAIEAFTQQQSATTEATEEAPKDGASDEGEQGDSAPGRKGPADTEAAGGKGGKARKGETPAREGR